MAWYEKAFNNAYLDVYSHRDETEAGQALELVERTCYAGLPQGRRTGGLTLDLCCGQGRYTRLLAGRGRTVVGLDLSGELLERARERLLAQNGWQGKARFVRGDMRRLPFGGVFDVVINMFTSFGYFDDDAENYAVLQSLAAVLKPEGRFFIDYLNRPQVIASLVAEDTSTNRGGLTVRQRRHISRDGRRVVKRVQIGGPRGDQEWIESVRMYSLAQMGEMIGRCGLELRETFGGYQGQAHSDDAGRLILTGRKP